MNGADRPGRVPRAAIAERMAWAMAALRAAGHAPDAPMGAQHKAWSVIVPIRTGRGAVFLKYVRGAFPHEAALTRALHTLAPGHVPEVLAESADLGCWISADAGSEIALRSFLAGGHLPALLSAHADLQLQSRARGTGWIDAGAKDLRACTWPGHLDAIRAAEDALDLDNVAPELRSGLDRAEAPLTRLVARMQATGLPDTIVHMDLRRTNVKLRRGKVAVIDWGDCGFGPAMLDPVPLFSEIATLRLPAADTKAQTDAAHAPWADLLPASALQEARALCRIVFPLLYAHGLIHARPSWDPTLPPTYHGLLQFYLKTFLDRLETAPG